MPYLKVQTNIDISLEQQTTLLTGVSTLATQALGKPEIYVMVALQPNTPMFFAGTEQPTAFLELKCIHLSTQDTTTLSKSFCAFIEDTLKIPKNRVYIEFINAEGALWGWNGRTF